MIRSGIIIILSFLALFRTEGQDIDYARNAIDVLASSSFRGRGYVKNGENKASAFIAGEFFRYGVRSFGAAYQQHFNFPVNTLPGDLSLSIAGHKLEPGEDYVISASTPSVKGRFRIIWDADSLGLVGDEESFVVSSRSFKDLQEDYPYQAAGAICIVDPSDNMWWNLSGSEEVKDFTVLKIRAGMIIPEDWELNLKVENKFIDNYRASNVIGWIKGAVEPDSFIVITAHYDHLGMMGSSTWFPGANDNASGVALMLDMIRHYSQEDSEPPPVSLAFMAFSGEEVGLKGSKYYAENPMFPLESIKALINLDMVGTGSQGITVVNGHEHPKISSTLENINREMKLLRYVARRSAACNSDHCPFYRKGVPAVYIFTQGKEYEEYHNIWDKASEVPLTAYEDLFILLTEFINRY